MFVKQAETVLWMLNMLVTFQDEENKVILNMKIYSVARRPVNKINVM